MNIFKIPLSSCELPEASILRCISQLNVNALQTLGIYFKYHMLELGSFEVWCRVIHSKAIGLQTLIHNIN